MTVVVFFLFLLAPICEIALADNKGNALLLNNHPKGVKTNTKKAPADPKNSIKTNGNSQKAPLHENANVLTGRNEKHHKDKQLPVHKNGNALPKNNDSSEFEDDLLSQALTHLRKMNEQLKNGNLPQNSDETLTTVYSLMEIESQLAKFDEKAAKTVQGLNTDLMTNLNNGKTGENQGLKELDNELKKIIEMMKNKESTAAKVGIGGTNGLAQILPKANEQGKSVRLQIYVQAMEVLKVIHERMELSPEKEAIAKVSGKSTVANNGSTVMPNQLVELMMELWTHFLQRVGKSDQNKATQTNPEKKQASPKPLSKPKTPKAQKTNASPKAHNNEAIPKNPKLGAPSNRQKQVKEKQPISLGNGKLRRRRRAITPIDSSTIRALLVALAVLCITILAFSSAPNPWAIVAIVFLTLNFQQANDRPNQIAEVIANVANRLYGMTDRHTERELLLNSHDDPYRNVPQKHAQQAFHRGSYRERDRHGNAQQPTPGLLKQKLSTPEFKFKLEYYPPTNRNNNKNSHTAGEASHQSRPAAPIATIALARSGNNQQNERSASNKSTARSERSGKKMESGDCGDEDGECCDEKGECCDENGECCDEGECAGVSRASSWNNDPNESAASNKSTAKSERSGEKKERNDESVGTSAYKCSQHRLGNSSSSSSSRSKISSSRKSITNASKQRDGVPSSASSSSSIASSEPSVIVRSTAPVLSNEDKNAEKIRENYQSDDNDGESSCDACEADDEDDVEENMQNEESGDSGSEDGHDNDSDWHHCDDDNQAEAESSDEKRKKTDEEHSDGSSMESSR
ncbi:hypothetical protein niasHT_034459 [Heterodera trifolii]|uniref:Effector protein n=1 Tax=Heterodera trifolii TaxID=157864 RepID=A0ABD2HP55_9BILA